MRTTTAKATQLKRAIFDYNSTACSYLWPLIRRRQSVDSTTTCSVPRARHLPASSPASLACLQPTNAYFNAVISFYSPQAAPRENAWVSRSGDL